MSRTRVVDELTWATTELDAAGFPSAAVDARLLWEWVGGADPTIDAVVDVTPEQRQQFHAAIGRRAAGVPVQHITGVAYFGPVRVAVGPGVFIPRPETEAILEWAVRIIGDRHVRVYDFCSGSGALAIAIATMAPNARVRAVEREPQALRWLRRNVADTPDQIRGRLDVVAADVTSSADLAGWSPAQVIVANPPYIPESDRAQLPCDVQGVDPDSALFGGVDGLSVIGPMVTRIAHLLTPDGRCAVEHDDAAATRVSEVVAAAGLTDVVSRRDLAGRPRFVTASSTGRIEA